MADEENLQEGTYEVPEEQFPEHLRGVIENLDKPDSRPFWLGVSFLGLLTVLLIGWFLYYVTLTEEHILKKQLENRHSTRFVLEEVERIIERNLVDTEELWKALDKALRISESQLRVSKSPQAPYIPEREEAMIVALKCLLRLDLEKEQGTLERFTKALDRLGAVRLEYYDSGLLSRIPLLKRSWITKEIEEQERLSVGIDIDELQNLHLMLKKVKEEESHSLLPAAELLGRWYRYQGNKEQASLCFEIGRKYVEGYTREGSYFEGHRPQQIDPTWEAYASCLKALSEIAFREKLYREARSFLTRLYNTPKSLNASTERNFKRLSPTVAARKIQRLRKDVALLQKVIETPELLPSFPLYDAKYNHLDWKKLISTFQKTSGKLHTDALFHLWDLLDPGTKELILKHFPNEEPGVVLKQSIIENLNFLISKPELPESIDFSPEALPENSKELLAKYQLMKLSEEETHTLNRSIIDHSLGSTLKDSFILSDGTYLTNRLSPSQKLFLQNLCKELLVKGDFLEERRLQSIRSFLQQLERGEVRPSIGDLQHFLDIKKDILARLLEQTSSAIQKERNILASTAKHAQSSESSQGSLEETLRLQRKEEGALERINQAKQRQAELREWSLELSEKNSDMTAHLKQKLLDAQSILEELENQQSLFQEQEAQNAEILISQLDTQIALRRKYLSLLEQMKETEKDKELEFLKIEKTRFESLVQSLKNQLTKASGDHRERLQQEMSELQQERRHLVQRFESLFDPLRKVVEEISLQEESIWQKDRELQEVREAIIQLMGTQDRPGTLGDLTAKRAALLLMKSEEATQTPLYDAEIKELNTDIAQLHSRLITLLRREGKLKDSLAIFHPGTKDGRPLFHEKGSLSPLRSYLKEQSELMDQYHLLTTQEDLLLEINHQENLIIESLSQIHRALGEDLPLSEKVSRELSRDTQNIVSARKKRNFALRQLRDLKNGHPPESTSYEVSGGGFLLDTADLYQMEHDMGLQLNAYQKTFEQRQKIESQLRDLLSEKELLQEKKRTAMRSRDQEEIDKLLPQEAELERILARLGEDISKINRSLRELNLTTTSNLKKIQEHRKSVFGDIQNSREKMLHLTEVMSETDQQLNQTIGKLFKNAGKITYSISGISENNLGDLEPIIEEQRNALEHLEKIRKLRYRENYYKAQSLWLIAHCLYKQSQLKDFGELTRASQIHPQVIEDEKRNGTEAFKEVDTIYVTSQTTLGDIPQEDENNASYQLWIHLLEESCLEIISQIPHYTPRLQDLEQSRKFLPEIFVQDLNTYIARSRFLMGEIHLNRSFRTIRTSRIYPKANSQAYKSLDLAKGAFLHFLDFASNFENEKKLKLELSEPLPGGRKFPHDYRRSVSLANDARIYLGVIASLQKNHSQAIAYNREVLSSIHQILKSDEIPREMRYKSMGPIDPILSEEPSQLFHIYPYYTSLLAKSPLAHEALYRLGKSYKMLAEEHFSLAKDNQILHESQVKRFEDQAHIYGQRAIAYLSQLILTQSYSPYRRAALLQRAMIYQKLGNYPGARNDLVSILGSPSDSGGSFQLSDITPRGDLPGELDPGYAYVAFQLGRLHLENKNFLAAADAFQKAKEAQATTEVLLQAKVAYAEALVSSKNWLTADLLLSELLEERKNFDFKFDRFFHLDLLLKLAKSKKELGDFEGALEVLDKVNQYAPLDLIVDGELELNNPYGLSVLETDYRDTIRPLAEAAKLRGEVYILQRTFQQAKTSFADSETLYKMIPWSEDRLMRDMYKQDFLDFKKEKILESSWAILKTETLHLQYDMFSGLRRELHVAHARGITLSPQQLLARVDTALNLVQDRETSYRELYDKLTAFEQQVQSQLPERIQKKEVLQARELDRLRGSQNVVRYDALTNIRNFILQIPKQPIHLSLSKLTHRFSVGTVEYELLNEFAMLHGGELSLNDQDRLTLVASRSPLSNLVNLEESNHRLQDLPEKLVRWTEKEMRATGLDDLFLPVSLQSALIEEVDLYRASILGHMSNRSSYEELKHLIDHYHQKMKDRPRRITNLDYIWQMTEIGALLARQYQDWQASQSYLSYLIDSPYKPHTFHEEPSLKHRLRLYLAETELELSNKFLSDTFFMDEVTAKVKREGIAREKRQKARRLLLELISIEEQDVPSIATRIRAKELLQEIDV